MAIPEELLRLDAPLRPLAQAIRTAVGDYWVTAVLDARFSDQDGSVVHQVRVVRPDETVDTIPLPADAAAPLAAVGETRPIGTDRWHALVIRMTAAGGCEVRFVRPTPDLPTTQGRARTWMAVAVAVAITIGLPVLGVAVNNLLDPFDDRPFDPAVWATGEGHEQDRGRMARDVIRLLPAGTPMSRVRELLGEPDEDRTGNPQDRWGRATKGYTRWIYDLGSWSGLGPYSFDHATLEIHFDRIDRVVEAEVTGG